VPGGQRLADELDPRFARGAEDGDVHGDLLKVRFGPSLDRSSHSLVVIT
jgi:hypothetical protein